jgi:hypothetical protein
LVRVEDVKLKLAMADASFARAQELPADRKNLAAAVGFARQHVSQILRVNSPSDSNLETREVSPLDVPADGIPVHPQDLRDLIDREHCLGGCR